MEYSFGHFKPGIEKLRVADGKTLIFSAGFGFKH